MNLLTEVAPSDPEGVMAQPRSVTRDMPQLAMRAEFDTNSIDVEKRTARLTWTTGARVLRYGWDGPYFEELSLEPKSVRMGRLQSGTSPVLDTHSRWGIRDVIGVVDEATLEKGGGSAVVRFDSGAEGEEAFRKVRERILRNVSVGYATYKLQKIEDGSTTIPVYRAVDWEPQEISMVPIGADAGAVTRSGGGMTPCVFIEERSMDPENETTNTPAQPKTPAPVATATPIDEAQVRAAERGRIADIQRIGRALSRPAAEIEAAVSGGVAVETFRSAAVDALAISLPADGGVIGFNRTHVVAGEDKRDRWMRGAGAWLVQRAAVGEIVGEHAKKTGASVDLDPGEFRGMRMVDLARQSLEMNGVRTEGMLPMDIIGKALTHRTASGPGASSSDFPVLLESTLHKVLLAAYGTTPDTWSQFCARGSVSDFRPHPRYRMGSFGRLSKVGENGEFVNQAIPDGKKESLTADSFGNIIGITRKALINDDLSAFSRLATMFGRSARLSVEVDVYALLALAAGLGPTMNDGLTLFHATHANLGAGSAIGATGLDADRVLMTSQKDPSGNEILDLRPEILLVPASLEMVADQIINSAFDFSSTQKYAPKNFIGQKIRTVIGTPRITGTRRYLFANPAVAPTIEVAFLDGQDQPFMDMQNGWRVDGVEWKIRLDYAVGAVDFRGAVTNAGA